MLCAQTQSEITRFQVRKTFQKHSNSFEKIANPFDLKDLNMSGKQTKQKYSFYEGLSQTKKQILINSWRQKGSKYVLDKIEKLKQTNCFRRQDLLKGGGNCCSNQNQSLDKYSIYQAIDEAKFQETENNHGIDENFKRSYNKVRKNTQFKQMEQIQGNGEQSDEIKNILQRLLLCNKDKITTKVNTYRFYTIEMFNLCMSYSLSGVDCIRLVDNRQIIDLLDSLVSHFKKNLELFPCLDLQFIFSFLYALNEEDFDKRTDKYDEIQLISEFTKMEMVGKMKSLIHLKNIANDQIDEEQVISKLKEGAFNRQNQQLESPWEIVQRIRDKILFSKDIVVRQIGVIQIEKKHSKQDELSFYINKFIELTEMSSSSQLSYTITYLMIQISFILERFIVLENQQAGTQTAQLRSKVGDKSYEKLIQILKQFFKSTQVQQQSFLKFSVQDIYFRFLSVKILLQFYVLNFQQDDLFIHLLFCYLTEKDTQIKIVFQNSKQFCHDLKVKLESKEKDNLIQQVIQYQQDRLKNLESNKISKSEIQNIVDEIKSVDDFIYKISLSLIEKWELEARQRLEADIADKNDILLEVQDLYIDQNIQFLEGKDIFEEKNKLESINAINLIREFFLIPKQKDSDQQCKILTILAEGGTGKSMLIKKLETALMRERSSSNQQEKEKGSHELLNKDYSSKKKVNFIPFMVKCNCLTADNPSLEEYFKQQGLSMNEIEQLQKMEIHKLILLDGYDEFTGDYFKIYQKLQLNNWKNTLFIVSSRMEKITQNDAKVYFSAYDQQGNREESSYCIVKLKEFEKKDILEYCNKFSNKFYLQQKQVDTQDQQDHMKLNNDEDISEQQKQFYDIMEQCLKNNQLENLLFLPINLYLFTRLIIGKSSEEIKEMIKNISDQIQIQDIFFKEQFKREAIDFINQNGLDIRNQQLQNEICNSYFLYFQTIAMQMFQNKGKQSNFLQLYKNEINFELQQIQFQSLNQKYIEPLKYKIQNYVNTKIITRVKDVEIDQDLYQQEKDQNMQIIEFKHKSLYEYFAARAMKHDFDQHKEDIYKLDMSKLSQFNINKRIIMTTQKNASEQQILLKLYKIIKSDIDSESFKQNYFQEDIALTNRYIQYLKKSQISQPSEKSQIDVGSSNLLSALFLSKFSFPSLEFSKCSFSQAYLPGHSRKCANFQDCNLENSFLENQYFERFETSNTKHSVTSSIQKIFAYEDVYTFSNAIFYKDTIISITKTGYINQFQFISDKDSSIHKKLRSNQITSTCLKQIYFVSSEDIFLTRTEKSLFEIDCNSFEKLRTFQFSDKIINLQINNSNYIVTLANELNYFGNIKDGFKQLDQIQGCVYQFINDTIITTQNNIIYFYNIKNQQLIKSRDFNDSSLNISAISADGKYLATVNPDGLSCNIYDLKEFDLIKIIDGYSQQITSIAFSKDGNHFASGSLDQNCKVFNVQKQFELAHIFQENPSAISSVSFSLDNKYLLLTYEQSLCVQSVKNKFLNLKRIEAHTQIMKSMALSSDGKYLATCSFDKTCIIWDMQNEFNMVHQIQAHTESVNYITFSPDGKYLATISQDKTCKIWDVDNKFQLFDKIQGDQINIDSIAFSADGKYLAATNLDKTFKIMKFEKGFQTIKKIENQSAYDFYSKIKFSRDMKYLGVIKGSYICEIYDVSKGFELVKEILNVSTFAFSPNGNYLATGCWEKSCRIYSVERNFEQIAITEEHSKDITSIDFSQDGKYLVTGSSDTTCKIWSIEKDFQLINTTFGHTQNIYQVAFSVDSKYLVSLSGDQTFKIWGLDKQFEYIKSLKGHANAITSAIFSPSCKYLITSSDDSTCRVYDTEKGFEVISTINQHAQKVTSVDFSPDGKYLATVSWDQTCKIFNALKEFELVISIQAHDFFISYCKFSQDGKYLATCSWDQSCKIWDVNNEFQLLHTIRGHSLEIIQVTFSYDGKYLATCSLDETCKIWNAQKEFEIITTIQGHTQGVTSVAFSKNGKYFVTGSLDNSFKIWEVQNQFQLIKTIEQHTHTVSSICFSLDDKFLATGSEDKTCKIWDVENQFELTCIVEGHSKDILHISFSPDGRYLTTSSQDISSKIWTTKKLSQQKNQDNITALAYSTDGKYIASCSGNNQWKIWEQSTNMNLKISNLKPCNSQSNNQIEFIINSGVNNKHEKADNVALGSLKEEKIKFNLIQQIQNSKNSNLNKISYQQLYEL
ncbi:WD domain, G-beta repeat protein (macronuclear) [Tetrahymena thermophila SB210]|uniref:WD domain, G-beta repeat protein n=1 Tax=Tetrahymena thermophila (strain SB210) TaxID=312017 RepID=Q23RU8_TETTS|nr:WD domain, G-beta repeat protein [Tetrahymena thermophila SB210]EAR99291.2 WD domain, G-beta repeat protein [Tetrahymena thermophila SB210]|eukprot:XP_001019536.2 WD domain, G-beta repeat protein [Tetrahymena thermophila SB210]